MNNNGNINKIVTPFKSFLTDLATYFMDFLETDFHKRRTPKRCIKYHDKEGLLLGFNLKKYETFEDKIRRIVSNGFENISLVSIKRNQHVLRLSEGLFDLVAKQVANIGKNDIKRVINLAVDNIKKIAKECKNEPDVAVLRFLEVLRRAIQENIISPIIKRVEKPIENQASLSIEPIYALEEGLVDLIVSPVGEIASELLNSIFIDGEVDIYSRLNEALSEEQVKSKINQFFSDFSINDLFFEIQEIVDNKHILDKQDIYLYFYDLQFGKNVFPVFYVPLSVHKLKDVFNVNFSTSIYINKKALEYVIQEFNKETGRRGNVSSIKARILYPHENQGGFREAIKTILDELTDCFELKSKFNIDDFRKQVLKSMSITFSNSCHICIFDKSDEALVNDYEEMLEYLSRENNPLADIFNRLINDFIKSEPINLKETLYDEWHELSMGERLVYPAPIPVNSEQRQILAAIRSEECKYIAVEGPPGTGKSHTIVAMVFDAIRDGKSVLVLSDKKEALDVVEDKITETMNKVRATDDFQNPILRLGKDENTYSKILSPAAIDNIQDHYLATRKNHQVLIDKIEGRKKELQEKLGTIVNIYDSIDIKTIQRLISLENTWGNEKVCPIIIPEFFIGDNPASDLETFASTCRRFGELLLNEHSGYSYLKLIEKMNGNNRSVEKIKSFIKIMNIILEAIDEKSEREIASLEIFDSINASDIEELILTINRCLRLKSKIFGYLFKRKKLKEINETANKTFRFLQVIELPRDLDVLNDAYNILNKLAEYLKVRHGKVQDDSNIDLIKFAHNYLPGANQNQDKMILKELESLVDAIEQYNDVYPLSNQRMGLKLNDYRTIYDNILVKLDEISFNDLLELLKCRSIVTDEFSALPNISYQKSLAELEELLTHEMTFLLDKRLLDFYNNNQSTAITLKKNIRQKRRFPKEEFKLLKEAFPCIVANIRDFAEYIPLEPELFDLVIIDEASQVSVAQAFPALLRAKKVVVLGDRKQFSNVKSAQARSDTNKGYLNDLEKSFKTNVTSDLSELQRFEKFNIKTSILEFFEHIANYEARLLKHFRGYREHISYSSKYFYGGDLQALKIRGKSIDEIIKFTIIDHDGKQELIENTNTPEIRYIINELLMLLASGNLMTVGIITPHTNQQKLMAAEISKLPERDALYEKMKLKIMTFDTCQGEERDIVFYSMVANPVSDRLWGIFVNDLEAVDLEELGQIKAQRLNVGFSRVKECMHFVLSKPISEFKGSIRQALQHFQNQIGEAKKSPDTTSVDPNSPMETKVLEWIKNTQFYQLHRNSIELKAQFPIGEYLKQLNKFYDHPKYRVDFLLIYRDSSEKQHNLIIEYDGFKEHFTDYEKVSKENYQYYYREDDIEREKTLEGYGYYFIRINRFNMGDDPIASLNVRIASALKKQQASSKIDITSNILETVSDIREGNFKVCPKCEKLKEISDFNDYKLSTGEGRICNECKKKRRSKERKPKNALPVYSVNTIYNNQIKCPWCGAGMVIRHGKYGKFYGCSQFPKCRGTRKVL